jgi:hypothetical protein
MKSIGYPRWVLGGVAVMLILSATAWGQPVDGTTYDPPTPERRGQAGMSFLQMGSSARMEAVGGAGATLSGDPAAVFYNVAGMAAINGVAVHFNRTTWIADMSVTHFALAANVGLLTTGITFMSMDYGEIPGTIIDLDAEDSFIATGNVNTQAWAMGAFIGVPMTDQFSFGVHVKAAVQDFGTNSNWIIIGGTDGFYASSASDLRISAIAVDVGSQYNTGLRNIIVAMSLRNYGRPQKFIDTEFDLPLTYQIGVAADAVEIVTGSQAPGQKLMVYLDGVDQRDVLLDLAWGLEYIADVSPGIGTALRVGSRPGYEMNGDGYWLNFGAGLRLSADEGSASPLLSWMSPGSAFGIDYSYTKIGPGFQTHMWSLSLGL